MQRRSLPAIATYVLLLLACAMPVWLLVHPIMPGENPDESGGNRAMAVWALSPYGGLFVTARRFASEAKPSSVILMGATLIAVPSVLAFLATLEEFSTRTDTTQNYGDMGVGILLMLWPLAAWGVVGLTTWVAKRTSRSADVRGSR